jgi:hypothetical protein
MVRPQIDKKIVAKNQEYLTRASHATMSDFARAGSETTIIAP